MIKVLRVDDRLLHGQVAVAWTNYYKVDTIVIANDKVITKTMQDAEYVCGKTGSAVRDVLLGGLRSGEGKKQIDMNSYMSEDDICVMDRMEQKGINIFMQADPASRKLNSEEIRRNFNK